MKKKFMNIHNNWNIIVVLLVGGNMAYENTKCSKRFKNVLESEKIEECLIIIKCDIFFDAEFKKKKMLTYNEYFPLLRVMPSNPFLKLLNC